mgnify:CR=1 FL=1
MMKKKKVQRMCFLIALFIMAIGSIQAQQGSIKGNVIDGETNEALPTASIVVKAGETKEGVITDLDGNFSVTNLIPGKYIVEVSFMGYKTVVYHDISVKSGAITPLVDIVLSLKTELIDEVILVGNPNTLDYGDDSKINLDAKEIENLPIQRNMGSIVKMMSTEAVVSEDGTEIHFRGARSNATAMMIDGVKITSGMSNIPTTAIGNFRIFSGGVPAEYGDFTGGIIVVESKDYFSLYQQYMAAKKYEESLKEYEEN